MSIFVISIIASKARLATERWIDEWARYAVLHTLPATAGNVVGMLLAAFDGVSPYRQRRLSCAMQMDGKFPIAWVSVVCPGIPPVP